MTLPRPLPRRTDPERRNPDSPWRRPAWKDPRLSGGIALIGAAVALGAWAVDAAADTTQIYVLSQDVPPGADLEAEGVLTTVAAHPGTQAYVEVGDLPQGAVSTRSLSRGELLPRQAVGSSEDLELRRVVLEVATPLTTGTGPGDEVDLWLLPDDARGQAASQEEQSAQAEEVATGLVVVEVTEASASMVGLPGTSVEVAVPDSVLASVLTSVGQGRSLALVPAGQEPVR
ncbi:hypothetical protein [Actinomyces wuliandei]|uniref:hypothetical protein n=1 Tax=Actinomyces wuliandei TaxID=2057743 RepID=UPI001FAA72D6|nr:hypothetical protein [Actinomyces wuliandei]